jgi:hypothetical protein
MPEEKTKPRWWAEGWGRLWALVPTLFAVVVLAVLSGFGQLSKPWPLPSSPARHRLAGCGCRLPEGGSLEIEVEVVAATQEPPTPAQPVGRWRRDLEWRLVSDAAPASHGTSDASRIQGTAMPFRALGDELDVHVGCTATKMVVAADGAVSAIELPTGKPLWTLGLARGIDAGLYLRPGLRCRRLAIEKGIVSIPNGDADRGGDHVFVDSGELTR